MTDTDHDFVGCTSPDCLRCADFEAGLKHAALTWAGAYQGQGAFPLCGTCLHAVEAGELSTCHEAACMVSWVMARARQLTLLDHQRERDAQSWAEANPRLAADVAAALAGVLPDDADADMGTRE